MAKNRDLVHMSNLLHIDTGLKGKESRRTGPKSHRGSGAGSYNYRCLPQQQRPRIRLPGTRRAGIQLAAQLPQLLTSRLPVIFPETTN